MERKKREKFLKQRLEERDRKRKGKKGQIEQIDMKEKEVKENRAMHRNNYRRKEREEEKK